MNQSIIWFPGIQDGLDSTVILCRDYLGKLWATDHVAIGIHIAVKLNVIAWPFQLTFDIVVSNEVLIEITFQLSSSKVALNLIIVPLISREYTSRAFLRNRISRR